jgi:cytochrome c
MRRQHALVAALAAAGLLAACDSGFVRLGVRAEAPPPVAEVEAVMRYYGCGACHTIPGVTGARGRVGPPLDNFNRRAIIAGSLPNTEENLTRFIVAPPAIRPGTAMPVTGISEPEAREVALYLLQRRPRDR